MESWHKLTRIIVLMLSIFLVQTTEAQIWLGHRTDNYSGLQRVHIQPATLGSLPYKYDIGVLGIQAGAVNLAGFDSFYSFISDGTLDETLDDEDFLLNFAVQLPSLAMRIDDKSAFAFEMKWLGNFFVESSESDMLSIIEGGFDDPDLIGRTFDDAYVTGRSHLWWEFSGSYGRQLYKKGAHQIDAGATLTLIYGTGSLYFNVDNLSFSVLEDNTLVDLEGQLQFVYTPKVSDIVEDGQVDLFDAYSFGASLGSEYRWTPSGADRYKLRAGFAFLDIGNVKYRKAENSEEYDLSTESVDFNSFRDVESFDAFSDSLDRAFDRIEQDSRIDGDDLTISMPTKLSLQFDYHVYSDFYLNFTTYIAIKGDRRRVDETFNTTSYVITPRYERQKWGIQLPMYYTSLTKFNTGISGRWGPIFIGMDNVIPTISKGDLSRITAYLGFKVLGWPK